MSKRLFSCLMLVIYALIVSCGTQGPLYIPEQRYPQKTQNEAAKTPDTTPTEKVTHK